MQTFKNCSKINKKLLPVKFHFFFFFAALACVLPFRTVLAKQLGVSATAIGVIYCVLPFLRIVTNPCFGFILDYFKRFRLTISLTIIMVAFSYVFLIFIPPKVSEALNISENDFYTQVKYSCHNNSLFLKHCNLKFTMYNENRSPKNPAKNSNSFACIVQCSDSMDLITTKSRSMPKSKSKIKSEFTVYINAFISDIDIQPGLANLVRMSDGAQNSVIVDVTEIPVRQLKRWITTYENCSMELKYSPKETNRKSGEVTEKNLPKNYLLEDFEKYVSIPVLECPDNGSKLFYVLQEFMIDLQTDIFFVDKDTSSLEYKCQMKKCFFRDNSTINSGHLEEEEENDSTSLQFWSLFILFSLSGVAVGGTCFMMDAVCYELLQDRRDHYGQQRIWGTIGWGVGALVAGCLNQIISSNSGDIDYTLSIYLLAVLMIVDLIPMYHLNVTDVKYSSHILKDVCFLFTKFDIVYNMILVFFIGALSGFIWNYQFWFMEEIGSSQVLLGLSQTVECLFELPWFLISGWIIKRIGHDHCNNITLLCFGLRYLSFAFMCNPWWSLPVGVFHGPTFGLFYASMTMYAKNKAPPGTEATIQSLMHLFFDGIGVATGSMLGGIGLDKLGSRLSFLYSSKLSFLLLFINILMGIWFSRAAKKKNKIKTSVSCNMEEKKDSFL